MKGMVFQQVYYTKITCSSSPVHLYMWLLKHFWLYIFIKQGHTHTDIQIHYIPHYTYKYLLAPNYVRIMDMCFNMFWLHLLIYVNDVACLTMPCISFVCLCLCVRACVCVCL